MSASAVDQIVSTFVTLPPVEQQQVIAKLGSLMSTSPSPEELAEQRLLARGVIDDIPALISDLESYGNRKLVKVKGQPLSETIIEERR